MKNLWLLLLAGAFALTPVRVSGMVLHGGRAAERGKEEKHGDKKLDPAKATEARTEKKQIEAAQVAALQGSGNPGVGNNSEVVETEITVVLKEQTDQETQQQLDPADTDSDYGENPHDWDEEGNENLSLKDFKRALRKPSNHNASRLIIIHKSEGKNLIKAVPENPETPIENRVEDSEIINLLKATIASEQPAISIEDLFSFDTSLSAEKLKTVFDRIDQAIAEQKKSSARILPGSKQEQLASILHNVILKREEKPSSHYSKADKLWIQHQQAWEDKTILEREFKNNTALRDQAQSFFDQVQKAYNEIDLEHTIAGRLAQAAERAAISCAIFPEPHVQILAEIFATLGWAADKFNKIWNERDVKAAEAALQEIKTALHETEKKLKEAGEKAGTLANKAQEQEVYARHSEAQRRKVVAETLHPPMTSLNQADWNNWATRIVTEGKGESAWITELVQGGMADSTWMLEEIERAWKKRLTVDEEKIRQQKKEFKEHMRPLNRKRYQNNKALQKVQREEQSTQQKLQQQREKHQKLKTELEIPGQTQEAFVSKFNEVAEAAQEVILKETAWLEAQERLTHQDIETLTHENVHAIEKTLILRHLNRSLDQVKIDELAWGYNNQLTSWLAYRLPESIAEQTPQPLKKEGVIPPPISLDEELEKLGRRLWAQEKRASRANAFSLTEHQGGEKKEELLETEKETPLKETAKPPTVTELVASIIIPTSKDLKRWDARKEADERIRERDALFAERKERCASMNEPKGQKPRSSSMISLFSYWGGSTIGSTPEEDKAVEKVTQAENRWFGLVQEADAERKGIPYANPEEQRKHWEQADRAAHKAWEERTLLQKEATLATHIKDEEEWNNDIDRWIAREDADKLKEDFEDADQKKRELQRNQKPLDPLWNEAYKKAVEEVDHLCPLAEAAEQKWIALANEEESVALAFEEGGEVAAEGARKKLELLDRDAMKLWEKVKEMSPEERHKKRMATFAKEKERIVTQPTTLIESSSEGDKLTLNETLNDIEDVLLYKLEADENARKEKIEQAAKNYFHDENAKKVWEEELTFEERHLYNVGIEDANEVYNKAAQKKIEEAQSNYDRAFANYNGLFILNSKQTAFAELKKAAAHLMKVKAEMRESELAREKKAAAWNKENDAIAELHQARESVVKANKEFEDIFRKADQDNSSQTWKLAKETVQTQVKTAYDQLLQAYEQLQKMAFRSVVEATDEEREFLFTETEYAKNIEAILNQRITSARRWNNIQTAGVISGVVITSPVWVPLGIIGTGIKWMMTADLLGREEIEREIRARRYQYERRRDTYGTPEYERAREPHVPGWAK